MPFFEPISPPPPEEHEQAERLWAPPRWDRPSEGTLPVTFGVSQLIGRTDNAALALDHLRVYPNGFQLVVTVIVSPRLPPELHMGGFASFSLMTTATTAPADKDKPNPPPPPPRTRIRRGMLDMAPRIGIRFSNGQSAGSAPQSIFEVAKDEEGVPTQPVIVGGGGGGGGGHFRFEYWVFPLPTPGPLEVFAEWPLAGMEETSVVISGDDVLDAAQQAMILWS
ncbi:MAG: hypothetical protein M3Q30_06025 [Actinomycetota bacterium]|nr:hypothetical protein [Actinomycetota bacterium]